MDTPNLHTPPNESLPRLGALLVAAGKIAPRDAERILALQEREGWRFGEAALRLGLVAERDLLQALHQQYDLPQLAPGHQVADELVAAQRPNDRCTEELRALRTQLLLRWYRQVPSRLRALAITSPGHGEGRSYVAANLAVLFAQAGERTLLIDADMRRPRQHRLFQLDDRYGLSSVLCGRVPPEEAAAAVPGLSRLRLLPAGAAPPNPLELLSRPAMGALLEHYAHDFDLILIDTPPALAFADAHALGHHAGHALLLARMDRTRVADVDAVARGLGNGGAQVVGTVLGRF